MGDHDIGEFVYRLDEYVRKWDFRVGEGVAQIAKAVLISLVHATPVKSGLARSNWQLANGPEPDNSGIDNIRSEEEVVQDRLFLLGLSTSPDVCLFNNVPYIETLNAGSSDQAPAGFVEAAVITGAGVAPQVVQLVRDEDFS